MRRAFLAIILSVVCVVTLAPSLEGQSPVAAKPVVAWPSGPLEVRVAFDGPVNASIPRSLVGGSIPFGEPDPKNPGRLASTAGRLGIAGAELSDDNRTLILATDPHPREASYLIPLPGGPIVYRLSGVEASWTDGNDEARPAWSIWWPSIDPQAVARTLKGSAEQEKRFPALTKPGRLTVRTLLALPIGKATIRLEASGPVAATFAGEAFKIEGNASVLTVDSTGEAMDLVVNLTTRSGRPAALQGSYRLGDEAAEKPIPLTAFTVPWAPAPPSASVTPENPIPDLSQGDPARGEAVFRGLESKCATCHKVAGQGGEVGPALDAIAGRDRAWIYRSIALPSVEINPEYVPYTVALKDGRIAAGIVRGSGTDAIRVIDAEGKFTVFLKSEIEDLRPSGTSIMPVGLEGAIGPEKMRDLVAYLASVKQAGSKK